MDSISAAAPKLRCLMFSAIPLACIRGTANRSQIEYQLYQPDLNQVLGFMNLIRAGQNSGIPVAKPTFFFQDQLQPGCAILMHNKVFFSFYLVHIAFKKEQWWPDMFARTFLSLPFCCCNCAGSCPHDGQPKCLGAMESSISGAISSSFPIEGGELSRMLFTGS